jgi:hypothetical protein
VLLFLIASALVIIVGADTHHLIPLYSVGVFISFTLSQLGMFKRWIRTKEGNWKHKALINGFGGVVTAIICVIIAINKFFDGAWIIILCIPILVFAMTRIRKHYEKVRENLKVDKEPSELIFKEKNPNHIIVPLQTINKSFIKSLNYSLLIGDTLEVYHVSTDEEQTKKLVEKYNKLGIDIPLTIENAPYRNVNETLIKYVDKRQEDIKKGEMITIVMPQFTIQKWWHKILHNQTSMFLRQSMKKRRNVAIVTIPYIIHE